MSRLNWSLTHIFLVALSVSGCGIFEKPKDPPLEGERIAVVLTSNSTLGESRAREGEIQLPPMESLQEWPQADFNAQHAAPHMRLGNSLFLAWKSSIGHGGSIAGPLVTEPVIGGGKVYTLDARFHVTALDLQTGERVWEKDVSHPEEHTEGWGGGLAFAGTNLFVTTAAGQVLSLDAATGVEEWRVTLPFPIRTAPTVEGSRVYVQTLQGTLHALDRRDGEEQWVLESVIEPAGIFGGAAPTVTRDGQMVLGVFASGEVLAALADTGETIWSEVLTSARRLEGLGSLPHIRARPVIEGEDAYVVSNGGRLVKITLRDAMPLWEYPLASIHSPALGENVLFVSTTQEEVVALSKDTGDLLWTCSLNDVVPLAEDEKDKMRSWAGPVLGGNFLWLVSSKGDLIALNAADGSLVQTLLKGQGSFLGAPIIADGTLVAMNEDATVFAFR